MNEIAAHSEEIAEIAARTAMIRIRIRTCLSGVWWMVAQKNENAGSRIMIGHK